MKKSSVGNGVRAVTFQLSDFPTHTKIVGIHLQRIVSRHVTDADLMSIIVTDAAGDEHFGVNYEYEVCDVRPDIVIPVADQADVITIDQTGDATTDNALHVWASAIGG